VIVGLSGYGRTGKGEVGKVLVKNFDFKEIAFADTLRDFLYQQNPWVSNNEGTRHGRLRDIIDTIGWERYKNCMYSKDLRELIQRTGTEAGRGVIGDNVWVNATMNRIDHIDTVITDVRFENEADAIRERGGEIWRINRPGFGPVNDHWSEIALDDYKFDLEILNDGGLDHLAIQAGRALPW
jgi:hypothetical protein